MPIWILLLLNSTQSSINTIEEESKKRTANDAKLYSPWIKNYQHTLLIRDLHSCFLIGLTKRQWISVSTASINKGWALPEITISLSSHSFLIWWTIRRKRNKEKGQESKKTWNRWRLHEQMVVSTFKWKKQSAIYKPFQGSRSIIIT